MSAFLPPHCLLFGLSVLSLHLERFHVENDVGVMTEVLAQFLLNVTGVLMALK